MLFLTKSHSSEDASVLTSGRQSNQSGGQALRGSSTAVRRDQGQVPQEKKHGIWCQIKGMYSPSHYDYPLIMSRG